MIETLKAWLSALSDLSSLTDTVKYLLTGVLVLLLVSFAAVGGYKVAQWRLTAAYESRISALTDSLSTAKENGAALQLGIAEQNKAVEVAQAKAETAQKARVSAQALADTLAKQSTARMTSLVAILKTATTCDQVLGSYWEMRK